MRQYHTIKSQNEDAVLLFHMGDFYEMFYEDATVVAKTLNIALTSRQKGSKAIPMCGFPVHAADSYISKLLRAGFKVAICDQIQDPKEATGVVERAVTRVITAGTLTEDALLEKTANNYLASVCLQDARAGLAWVDLSTGEFQVEELDRRGLAEALARVEPAECLVPGEQFEADSHLERELGEGFAGVMTTQPEWTFDYRTAYKTLTDHFETVSLEGFGCEHMKLGLRAAGSILRYLSETHKASLAHISRLRPFAGDRFLLLDHATRRGLELLETSRDRERRGSLLWVLDHTVTAMGARLLRSWIVFPLRRVDEIRRRQEAITELLEGAEIRREIRERMGRISDMERIAAKSSCGRASPRDLLALKDSLAALPALRARLGACVSALLSNLRDQLVCPEELRELLERSLDPNAPNTVREGGIIKRGYSADLDELRDIGREAKSWMARFQAEQIRRAAIPSLKVGFNKVFGYYIEVTNTHADRVPPDYVRKQTLKNAERYITPELKEFETKVLGAAEKSQDLEYELFCHVREEVARHTPTFQKTARAVSETDVLAGLADVAAEDGYRMPEVIEEPSLEIRDGRHPVLEKTLTDEPFIPNDALVGGEHSHMLIITGPNMAGKSTYIRQVALLVLMAQMGSAIPASSARIGVADRIFTRVGASDEIARGRSTFLVEMNEAANILNNATPASLIILDEIGRGTSTFDGISIAWAVGEYIVEHIGARTLFATHYHELTELSLLLPQVANYNIAVREWADEIVFLHKIVEGPADKSYGIQVARLAGVPKEVVERSKTILRNLEAQALDSGNRPSFAPSKSKEPVPGVRQFELFAAAPHPVVDQIRKCNLDTLAPLEALLKLKQWKDEIEKREGK